MQLPFKDLFKRFREIRKITSSTQNVSFIKTNKQVITILGVVFVISIVFLFCYWFLKERPYYNKLLTDKDELIKTLKFMRDKQKKIYENSIDTYEKKLADEYILKSTYDGKVSDYEEKLASYKDNYISKEDHQKKIAELEQRYAELEQQHKGEHLSQENLPAEAKEDYDQKITTLEQKVSLLEDKNLDLRTTLEESLEFIKQEKEALEDTLLLERKKALIPSLILPETKNNAITENLLKGLVAVKDKLEAIEEMNIPLRPDTYFEMGLVSYYNKQYDQAIEKWENAVSLNKNNFKAYICLGVLYNEENMFDNAVKVLHRAIKINPKYATLHLALARTYEQKGALNEAIYEYSKVLEITPETIDIHNILGTLYEKKGLKEEAKKSFAMYEKLKGGNK